jgi:hypothetical protein
MKNDVTNFLELHIIYAAAVATVRMSGVRKKATRIIHKIYNKHTMGKQAQETNQ